MNTAKYTPGPWSTNDWPQSGTNIAIGAVGTPLIAKVPLRDVSINEQKANASLISAAPELLESLQEALKIVDAYRRVSGGDGDITAMNARSAIAKATGVTA